MHAIRVAIAGGALALAAAPALAEGPSIYTRWADVTVSQQACLQRAQASMKAAGVRVFRTSEQSVFGARGNYTITARCSEAKKFVFFAAAGPNGDECQRLGDQVAERF